MRGKLVAAVAAACLAACTTPAGASAAGCGGAVLQAWAKGKLTTAYPVHCYQSALDAMPEDMRSYTSAPDDIQRTLLAKLRPGDRATARHDSARREALSATGVDAFSRSTGIPRPLVALAGIGVLLVVTGSAGLAVRRLRARADS
jgi:hypothetical protein